MYEFREKPAQQEVSEVSTKDLQKDLKVQNYLEKIYYKVSQPVVSNLLENKN